MRTRNQLVLELKSFTDIYDEQMRHKSAIAWYETLSNEEKALLHTYVTDAINHLSLSFEILSKGIMAAAQDINRAFQSSAWQNILKLLERANSD